MSRSVEYRVDPVIVFLRRTAMANVMNAHTNA